MYRTDSSRVPEGANRHRGLRIKVRPKCTSPHHVPEKAGELALCKTLAYVAQTRDQNEFTSIQLDADESFRTPGGFGS